MNGGDLVVAGLVAHGVDTVFGIPGTHNLEIYRALDGTGIRHVTPRHEQGAGYAADGYARSTGRPGVAVVTTGPAVLNIATAVGQAYSDSVPMLVIAPGMPLGHPAGTGLLHEARDQTAALAAVAGRAHRVTSQAEIVTAIAQAFADFATDRPRPVVLEIPLDLLTAEVAAEMTGTGAPAAPIRVPRRQPDPRLVEEAAAMLDRGENVVLVVGGGAKRAYAAVVALAEKLAAPVLTTTNGKGVIPDDHPLALTSALHLPAVAGILAAADVVLALGTELGPTDFWSGLPDLTGKLVRVDVDPRQIVLNATPAIAIVADCEAAVMAIFARVAARSGEYTVVVSKHDLDFEGSRWSRWMAAIDAAAGNDAIYAADNAMACYYGALGQLPVRRPGGFMFPTGFGTLGFAVPAGIGARIGHPDVPVIALSGDGGLMFSVAELATAAAERVTLPVVVFDNGGYGEIRAQMRDAGIAPIGVDLPGPDFVNLAIALGGHGVAVTTPDELRDEIRAALRRPGPTLIVVPEERP